MEASPHRLRVAHIITQLELGGAQGNTLYTLSKLDAKRYEPILICGGEKGELDDEAKAAAWPTRKVRWLVRPISPIKDILAFVALYNLLRQLKPHIVHTHSSKAGILGRIAAYLAGVPVIIHTFHGFGFNNQQRPWTRWFFINLERVCAYLSTSLIFVSEANREEANHLGIGRNIHKELFRSGIYMGKDHRNPDKKKVYEKLNIPNDAWIVVSVGNFKPQKNPMDLARVAALVLKQRPTTHFILVGDGELLDGVKAWCREQHIDNQVRFPGWCTRETACDVTEILAISKCFLLTSLWEGLPRALVEALMAKLPAVAYGVDGVKDILKDGENGFLIPPRDVALAAEKIIWLADHSEDALKMGQKGHDLLSDEFDIDKMVREQEDLYQKLYDAVPLKNYYEPLWALPPKPEE